MLAIRIAATAAAVVYSLFVGRKKRCWLPSGCGEENSQQHNRWSLSLRRQSVTRFLFILREIFLSKGEENAIRTEVRHGRNRCRLCVLCIEWQQQKHRIHLLYKPTP